MGLSAHSDHGLVTLLIQNETGAFRLQVHHNGKWVNIDPVPNSFLANVGGHVEILSNGKYKSVLHQVVVNNRDARISIALAHAPAWDAVVGPASKLVEDEQNPPAYRAMAYKEYLELQQSNMLDGEYLEHTEQGDLVSGFIGQDSVLYGCYGVASFLLTTSALVISFQ
ncbi:hypothetical protein HRI_002503900 [Hibiscus trionum]|nr:hypothetical protein HRI_002503900 [Hibiscus trionum]